MLYNYILSIFLLIQSLFHPFYISLTEIKYNARESSLEISQKIFWDDLELELTDLYASKIDFLKPKDKADLDRKLKQYILQNNEILVNGKKAELNYLGYEIEEDAAWFYFEAKQIPRPQKVEVRNSILHKYFDSQQNIINFYLDKSPKSLILLKGKDSGKLTF
ncbi:MAG: hypothetical protein Q8S11_01555 [Daejeonella sp.]|uniref:DUF6702 family protein n=1 Tax=Daejeonella sp. TaxID=2805397 RepID=UPI00273370BD|nr:DUF6702 family protein [Daejeonella sp.]MDP3466987.1 hypothetical protein [Daejeonella sp.]